MLSESEGNLFGQDKIDPIEYLNGLKNPEEFEQYKKEINQATTEKELHDIEEHWGGKKYSPGQSLIPESPYHQKLLELFKKAHQKEIQE